MKPFPVSRNSDEVYAALEGLAQAQLPEGYDEDHRRKDFHEVFFGSDPGKRVFSQLGAFCDVPSSERDADSHGILAHRDGRRAVMRDITRALTKIQLPTVEKE